MSEANYIIQWREGNEFFKVRGNGPSVRRIYEWLCYEVKDLTIYTLDGMYVDAIDL